MQSNTDHEFDDRAYVRKWAESADQRRPERAPMFARIVELLRALPDARPHVVELGCGPGTLGDTVLTGLAQATYEGFDYSPPMLELAQERLAHFGERARLHETDLRCGDWRSHLVAQPQAIITNQALHDLGSAEAVEAIYAQVFKALRAGGLFINAELLAPAGGSANKPGKLPLERHLQLLNEAGFADVHAELVFGEYAGIVGRVPA